MMSLWSRDEHDYETIAECWCVRGIGTGREAAGEGGQARAPGAEITITIPPDMLQRLDALEEQTGQTRAGLLLLGAARLLRDGV
jgi:hypothetical protein